MKPERMLQEGGPSRRELVVGAALVSGALVVGCSPAKLVSLGAEDVDFGAFGPFLRITPDGAVTVVAKHAELGQGAQTGLAAIVAEELDADWAKVSVADAPANAKIYANNLMGMQGTGGSTAIAEAWTQMRKAGAAARALLVQAAAQDWKVPTGEISVKDGIVSHALSGKTARFAELLPAAAKQSPPKDPKLKDPAAFTLIGTERVRRLDARAKSTGATVYTQDVHLPGMLTAVVAHAPRIGAKVKRFDASAAKKVPGVVDVVKIPTGVAVIAQHTWAAMKGREALSIEWDSTQAETRSSADLLALYHDMVAGKAKANWRKFEQRGDPANAFGADALSFDYDFPYLAHAPMEPMNCIAAVNGNQCKLTFGCQTPSLDQINAARIVLTLPGDIEIETLPAGGSFGRRSVLDSDYVAECVHIAKHVGRGVPVKLVWSREDDMRGGKYRPLAHHAVRVKLGADGFPAAWRHRIVSRPFLPTPGADGAAIEGVKGSPYLKAIPVVDAQAASDNHGASVSWWRSVGATHTAMAMEHTIDQLAHKAGQDPLRYRRALLEKAGAQRHLAVLSLAADKAGWSAPIKKGWARGVAVHESFGTVVATIAEVSLVNGEPKVRRAVQAVDCGLAVAPDQIRAQMEGGLQYGLGSALYGAITLKDGAVEQSNFDRYRVLRMSEAPAVETHILPSAAPPSGAGEPGTPVIIPAVANALLTLTGRGTSALPFVQA